MTIKDKKKKQAYMKEYGQRPEVKERDRLYRQRPEVRARKNERALKYYHKPEVKERVREWRKGYWQRPEIRAREFIRTRGCSFEEALFWQLMPIDERICHLCGHKNDVSHLDHDHDTKKIRGWSHKLCNAAEGYVKNSVDPTALLYRLVELHGKQ